MSKRQREDGQLSKEAYYEEAEYPYGSSYSSSASLYSHGGGMVGWGGSAAAAGGGSSGSGGSMMTAASQSPHLMSSSLSFQRATPSTLASRRLVKPKKLDRRKEYLVRPFCFTPFLPCSLFSVPLCAQKLDTCIHSSILCHKNVQEAVKALNQRFQAWVVDQVKLNPGVSLAENALEYLSYVSQLDARYLRKQGEVFTVRVTGLVVVGGPRGIHMWCESLVSFSFSFSFSLPHSVHSTFICPSAILSSVNSCRSLSV